MIKYKCLSYDEDCLNNIDDELKKRFKNTFRFSNNDINKSIFLREYFYSYEYMDEWEKLNETPLLQKEEFYSNLNKRDLTDPDYMFEKRVCKYFEIKNLGEYHAFYLESYIIHLADISENFRKNCLDIYHIYQKDPANFFSAPGLAWQDALKKTKVELEILIEMISY